MTDFEGFPLSPQQKMILQTGNSQNLPGLLVLRISGTCSAESMRSNLEKVVERHEILRTTYPIAEGMTLPFQVCQDEATIHWHTHSSEASFDPISWLESQHSHSSDLDPDGLHAWLSPIDNGYLLCLRIPPLAADGWSIANVAADLADFANGTQGDDEDIAQYTQFSEWLRELAEDAEEGTAFWLDQPAIPAGPLPDETNHPFKIGRLHLSDEKVMTKVATIAAARDISEQAVLLSAWALLLGRLSNTSRLSIATAFHGRPFDELDRSLGTYTRFLPLTFDLDKATFATMLSDAHSQAQQADDWQDYYALGEDAQTTSLPFAFELETLNRRYGQGQTQIEICHREHMDAPFKLKLNPVKTEDGWHTTLYYDAGRYSQEAMRRLGERYLDLLERLEVSHSPQTVSICSHQEIQDMLFDFNQLNAMQFQSLPQSLAQQAAKTPQQPAVVFEGASLTFADLLSRTKLISTLLKARGVHQESPVLIALPPSIDQVPAVLGILQAGGTALPIPPDSPYERTASIIRENGIRLGIIDTTTAHRDFQAFYAILEKLDLNCIDLASMQIDHHSDDSHDQTVSAHNLACIQYTAGSAKSKAIQITHQTLQSQFQDLSQQLRLSQKGSPQKISLAPLHSELAMIQIAALGEGHCLFPISAETRNNREALHNALKTSGLDAFDCSPEQLASLLEESNQALPDSLIIAGNSQDLDDSIIQALSVHQSSKLLHLYGPEAGTLGYANCSVPSAESDLAVKPQAGRAAYILDSQLNPVPSGLIGHVYLAGDSLPRAIAHQPATSAAFWIPDPFSKEPGSRMLRTQDLARFDANNQMILQGYSDTRSFIQSTRVSLSEIEATMTQHAQIEQAKLLVRANNDGVPTLIGYYTTPSGHQEVDPETLAEWLAQRLLPVSLPNHLLSLPQMPLNEAGAIDEAALPSPAQAAGETGSNAPSHATERRLLAIWEDILDVKELGIHDDFFANGGHSLNAAVLAQRVRAVFRVTLSLRDLFQNPTVDSLATRVHELVLADHSPALQSLAESASMSTELDVLDASSLAALIERFNQEAENTSEIVANDRSGDLIFPLSFAQQRLWFVQQLEGGSVYNTPAAVRFHADLDLQVLSRCFSEIEARHEALRTRFVMKDDRVVQEFDPPRTFDLQLIDLSHYEPDARQTQLEQRLDSLAKTTFDLARGPIWDATVFKLGPQDQVVAVNMHHICSDAWSMRIFTKELDALYTAFSNNQPSPLPPLPIQYADYALWQRNWLEGEVMEEELAYWRKKLGGYNRDAHLPYDHSRPEKSEHKGCLHQITLTPELSESLRQVGYQEDTTLYMTLLTAFYLTAYSFGRREDLVIGADMANRNQKETQGLIGFFINQLALRTQVEGRISIRQLLQRVKETTLEAYEHAEVPFDQVVKALDVDRSSPLSPLYQAKFFMDESGPEDDEGPDHLDTNSGAARLDLTMGMWQHPDRPLAGWINYDKQLFLPETIATMAQRFEAICQAICDNLDASNASVIDAIIATEQEKAEEARRQLMEAGAKKFVRGRRKRVAKKPTALVNMQPLDPAHGELPLMITPASNMVDLPGWLTANTETWQKALYKHGAILFRGFDLGKVETFKPFTEKLISDIFKSNREHREVTKDGAIQTPVVYSHKHDLLQHSENSFNWEWPQRIVFACAITPESGGETPLVDNRRMMRALPSEIVEEFTARGVMYVRNYSEQLGLSWQNIFATEDPRIAEQRCIEANMQFSWHGDQLRTIAVRPAVWPHPVTGEVTWFNQAQHWHFYCLDETTRNSFSVLYSEENYPRNCYFGDGGKIDDQIMETILQTYRENQITAPWQQGDAVLVDNVLTAHARNAYTGDRKILVCMGNMATYK